LHDGNDRQVTVGHDDTVTVKNDRKTEITHDRREHVGNDETLIVDNDRKMSVKGKQEHTTTGDHISLVKGTKSLEVKGDLAQKISGALGFKVQGDIVLESSGKVTEGGRVIRHPSGRGYRRCEDKPEWRWESGDVIKPLPVTELGSINSSSILRMMMMYLMQIRNILLILQIVHR
jgi:type VI secretion system secreted protein VgrG